MKFSKISLSALLVLIGFFAQAQTKQIIDKIIAKVDNYIILKSELEMGYEQYITSGNSPDANTRCMILQQLLMSKVLVAKADIDSVIVEEKRIDTELDRRMNYFIQSSGGIEKLEKGLGKSVITLKEELRPQVREQLTANEMQDKITADITVTPAEVKRFFAKFPKDSIPFLPAEVQVAQIMYLPVVNKAEKERVKNQLLEIKQRLLAGEDFGILAKKYSEDLGSAAQGGSLGYMGRGDLVPEFEATALRLDIGQIADPVESEFGFHLIQLVDRMGDRFNSRHILIRPKASEADIAKAEHFLDSIRTRILIDSISFERAAKEYSKDKQTTPNGGFFTDPQTGSTYVSTEVLDPIIFFTIDSMKIESITKPMRFRSEDGKDAVRMIYYKSKISPHYANLKQDYQKIYTAALEDKKTEVLEKWFEKAKKDVFIDIDPEYKECEIME